jgi:hypothetical protein
MKRDWDLFRYLLAEAEKCPSGHPLVVSTKGGATYSSVCMRLEVSEIELGNYVEHILLLADCGFAVVREFDRAYSGPTGAVIDRLTNAGHDFLSAAQNETAWDKTKQAASGLSGITVGIFKDLLIGYAKAEIAKHTGINLG